MLVITADESEGVTEDSHACCGEGVGPNAGQPGIDGPGGGRIGALVISPFVASGHVVRARRTTTTRSWRSIEELFGLNRLGYAETVHQVFGGDVYNAG